MSKKIGFLRLLNEENTIAACLLSVAPVYDHVAILWSDTTDRSIELAREWEGELARLGCTLSFVRYPHHVVPPRAVPDLRKVPVVHRIDTYLNFGMKHIRGLYPGEEIVVTKVDADQVYLTEVLAEGVREVQKPGMCISMCGHNTVVRDNRLMLFHARPKNGVGDHLACGSRNLPRYGIAAPYEVDVAPHNLIWFRKPCWMHFRRELRMIGKTRPFLPEETHPLAKYPVLMETYKTQVQPLLLQTGSPYASLLLD